MALDPGGGETMGGLISGGSITPVVVASKFSVFVSSRKFVTSCDISLSLKDSLAAWASSICRPWLAAVYAFSPCANAPSGPLW